MSDAELRIPKIPIAVQLAARGEAPRSLVLFIAQHLADRDRPEHLLDLLEGEDDFLPVEEEDGAWSVIHRAGVRWVSIALAEGRLPVEETDPVLPEPLYDHCVPVSVQFAEETLDGELLFTPPPGHARLADQLNAPGRFLRLWTASHLYLINKAEVLRVCEGRPHGGAEGEP